ncbi:hypothetical protein [Brevundimonas sp.]|uniref:hypothetical protein n=1 Tax=Brevundimonas sp. TaxID=1871086 RepID=UPI0028ABAD79|nr:hypothetical protein [Brevundimonas sp.]
MTDWIRESLTTLLPYCVFACVVLLIVIAGLIEKTNHYLRHISLLLHIQTGRPANEWHDVGKRR